MRRNSTLSGKLIYCSQNNLFLEWIKTEDRQNECTSTFQGFKAKKNIPVALSAAPDLCEDNTFFGNLIYCGKNNLFLL